MNDIYRSIFENECKSQMVKEFVVRPCLLPVMSDVTPVKFHQHDYKNMR